MVPWYWILISLLIGGVVTSIVEYKLKYNLTDEELDVLKGLEQKAIGLEKALIAKIKGWL